VIPIHPESPEDYQAIFKLHQQAFGTEAEARLVDELRPVVHPMVSLVAELRTKIVGHILFSPVSIERRQESAKTMGLAPMAVMPGHQRQGIGSQLVREGMAACKALGGELVFVVGYPEFYPRFGFKPASESLLRHSNPKFDAAFLVAELVPGSLKNYAGTVAFHPIFNSL